MVCRRLVRYEGLVRMQVALVRTVCVCAAQLATIEPVTVWLLEFRLL